MFPRNSLLCFTEKLLLKRNSKRSLRGDTRWPTSTGLNLQGWEEGREGGEGWIVQTYTHTQTYTYAHIWKPCMQAHTHMHANTQTATHPPKRSLLSLCWLMFTTTSLCPATQHAHSTSFTTGYNKLLVLPLVLLHTLVQDACYISLHSEAPRPSAPH